MTAGGIWLSRAATAVAFTLCARMVLGRTTAPHTMISHMAQSHSLMLRAAMGRDSYRLDPSDATRFPPAPYRPYTTYLPEILRVRPAERATCPSLIWYPEGETWHRLSCTRLAHNDKTLHEHGGYLWSDDDVIFLSSQHTLTTPQGEQ